jgi:K+-transporting ATPase KdpF subunit
MRSTLVREEHMGVEYIVGLTISLGILVYLLYALLWPEKF